MAEIPKLISKTKIMLGYQCLKNVYLAVHRKDLIPPVTPELQALFDQGNEVTVEARKRFPGGVLVDFPAYDFVGSLRRTRELLAVQTEHIFEAAFEYKGCYARADVISYNPLTQRWSVVEVKSTTKVKDEHLDDVGLQVWIMVNAGLPIEKISIMHLNNLCKFPNLSDLFVEEDVTDKLRERHRTHSPRLNEIFQALRNDEVPDPDIGPHCFTPRECQFKEFCWAAKKLPDPSVFDIPGYYEKQWEMYRRGIVEPEKIPRDLLDEKQQVFVNVLATGMRFVDKQAIGRALDAWKFPLVFLDFETVNPAIPIFAGTGPFTQTPFQFSVHVLRDWDSAPEHTEFLFAEPGDPRPTLVPALLKACGEEGSVVAYYAQFESNCIRDLEEFSPADRERLESLRKRLVDPLPLIREAVYDAQFKSSFSIKSVGPALLGKTFSYESMDVGDGGAAQRAFKALLRPETPPPRKESLKRSLLEYCGKDTFVMVELVKWLHRIALDLDV